MPSGSEKRRELRQKRMEAEAKARSGERRQTTMKLIGIGVFAAVVIVVVAIVISLSGGSDDGGDSDVNALLKGIPQNGKTLGDPGAKVTLIEFGDLRCPACKAYSETVTPAVIKGPVRQGKAAFEFETWPIIPPISDSKLATHGAMAASLQDRYWNYIENFYINQGNETEDYVDDDFLTSIAEDAGVPNMDKWEKDRKDPELVKKWNAEMNETTAKAAKFGFTGTPSFAIEDSKGKVTPLTDISSSDALIKAIDQAQ